MIFDYNINNINGSSYPLVSHIVVWGEVLGYALSKVSGTHSGKVWLELYDLLKEANRTVRFSVIVAAAVSTWGAFSSFLNKNTYTI